MARVSRQRRIITPAQRGQIVQRVLVDGWTATQAAHAAGVGERQVAAWVAAYRRDGMASLYRDTGNASFLARRVWRPIVNFWRGLATAWRRPALPQAQIAPSPLPRPRDDRRHGG
jgi:hypothetical protein